VVTTSTPVTSRSSSPSGLRRVFFHPARAGFMVDTSHGLDLGASRKSILRYGWGIGRLVRADGDRVHGGLN
jgi:hypothetical protein